MHAEMSAYRNSDSLLKVVNGNISKQIQRFKVYFRFIAEAI
jgi:hypothetical protein